LSIWPDGSIGVDKKGGQWYNNAAYRNNDDGLLQRPVFSLLEKGPLKESCTYLPYDAVEEIAQLEYLAYLSDSMLDEYAKEAE
jgi:hypothetical protein